MRKLVAFLLTGLALYGAYWFAANRLFDEGSYRKQVAFGSVFVPYGWAYALGFLGALVLLVLLYSLLYTALVNRLQGRRKSPWPLFLQGVTHLFLWVLILLVYYPVVQVVAASFDPTNNLFSFRRPDTGFLLVDAKVIPYLPNPSLENYAKLVEGVVLYPYQVALALLAGLALLGVGIVGLLRRLLAPEAWMDFWQGRLLFLMALLVFALALSLSPRQFTGQGTETKFLLWVRNTFLISGLTGLLAVLLTATAGYAFARFRHLPGRYPMLLFFIFVQMFPGFLALVAIYYLLSWLDLLNTFTGLVLAYSGGIISFGTWVYKGYLESISLSPRRRPWWTGPRGGRSSPRSSFPSPPPCSSSSSSCSSWAPIQSSSWPTSSSRGWRAGTWAWGLGASPRGSSRPSGASSPRRASWAPYPSSSSSTGSSSTSFPATPRGP